MKKFIALLLVLVMALSLVACAQNGANADNNAGANANTGANAGANTDKNENTEQNTGDDTAADQPADDSADDEADTGTEEPAVTGVVRLGGLKGATTIGMVKLLKDDENGLTKNDYEFTMAAAADELTPKLLKGELDVLAVPANLGSILYNNSNGAVQFLAINTLGVVYIVEKGGETVTDWESLAGKTIYATGKGTTPENALRYLLTQHGLDPDNDVNMVWKSEPTEVVGQMAKEDNAVAMLPQPFVTVAQAQVEGLRIALDLTKSWDELGNGSQFVTAGLIARTDFVKENPEVIELFLEEYKASTEFVNANPADAGVLVEELGIVKAPIATKAIPYCNIVCITGEEMRPMVQGYLEVLYGQNPKAVGGSLPDDAFYYVK